MRKVIALFLLSLFIPISAAEWRDDSYACAVNLPESNGWAKIKMADVPGSTTLIIMQNPTRQVAFGVNVLNNLPNANLSDANTLKSMEQLMQSLTYQFAGHSKIQIGSTSWLQYPVVSTFNGLNAKGIVRFASGNGRVYAVSMLAGGGKDPGADSEMQQAAASFRILQSNTIAAAPTPPVVATLPNVKSPENTTEPTTTPSEAGTPPNEEAGGMDFKRIAIFASGAIFVMFIFFQIIGKGAKAKPTPAPVPKVVEKNDPKPKVK